MSIKILKSLCAQILSATLYYFEKLDVERKNVFSSKG